MTLETLTASRSLYLIICHNRLLHFFSDDAAGGQNDGYPYCGHNSLSHLSNANCTNSHLHVDAHSRERNGGREHFARTRKHLQFASCHQCCLQLYSVHGSQ